jgi:hypothetical protein
MEFERKVRDNNDIYLYDGKSTSKVNLLAHREERKRGPNRQVRD